MYERHNHVEELFALHLPNTVNANVHVHVRDFSNVQCTHVSAADTPHHPVLVP